MIEYAQDGLNFRLCPSVTAPIECVLTGGEPVTITGAPRTEDGYVWLPGTVRGTINGWCAAKFLSPDAPTVPPPVPGDGHPVYGFHVLWNTDVGPALDAVRKNKAGAVLCLENWHLTDFLDAGALGIYRHWWPDGNGNRPPVTGTPADVSLGKSYWASNMRPLLAGVDKRAIIQTVNEPGMSFSAIDGYFWLGVMQAADDDGRKVVIGCHAVGNLWLAGSPGAWKSRHFSQLMNSGALDYCVAHGHYYGYHAYGADTWQGGNGPAYNDPLIDWFGAALIHCLETVPAASRPKILLTECGTWNAKFVSNAQFVADVLGLAKLYAPWNLKGLCYWSVSNPGDEKWGPSNINPAIPDFEAAV